MMEQLQIDPAVLDEQVQIRLARYDFYEYVYYMAEDFCKARPFIVQITDAFQWLYEEYVLGIPRRISISMPPRAGKSYIASLFCSWWLGKFPQHSIMRNTCTARLYEKFSRDVRAIVQSEKYLKVFPAIKLHPTNQALEGWSLTTSVQVGYFGAGVGGTIIGFGANLAMSDDLYKDFDDASSENRNETVASWKESAHDSRFEGNCPEVFIGTRWLKRDVMGEAIEKGKIHRIVKIPALTEDNKSFCEAVRTTEQYLETKADIDESIWDAEYMQEPGDVAGVLFPKSQLKFYDPEKVSIEADHKLTYIDPANEGGDDLACPLGYLVDKMIYIPEVIYNNNGTDINEAACSDMILREKADAVRIEANSAWYLFAKDVRKLVMEKHEDCDFRTIQNLKNKKTRILVQSQWIKNHFVFRSDYEKFPEYKKFIKVLTSYLRNGSDTQKDDAPDSLTGMAEYYRSVFRDIF